MKNKHIFTLYLILSIGLLYSQSMGKTTGSVEDSNGEILPFSHVKIIQTNDLLAVNENGRFTTGKLPYGKYSIVIQNVSCITDTFSVSLNEPLKKMNFVLQLKSEVLDGYTKTAKRSGVGAIGKIRPIEGTMIAQGKKAEIINLKALNANLATNNSRQIYARIPGLNIWESDGAGIQLGIGGRGLSPSRTSNYNTRQNGYDISADALGYPESYYTPPSQAIETIQFIKGASSLQFGPQFGGVINFKLKQGDKYRTIGGTYQKTFSSFQTQTTYVDAGGKSGRWRYFGYFNRKKGNEWRPNSDFELFGAGLNLQYYITENTKLRFEFTKLNYLAHQPGGLTDNEFSETPFLSKRERNWFEVDWNLFALNLDHEFNSKLKLNSKIFGLKASRNALGFLGQINRVDHYEARNIIQGNFRNFGWETRLLNIYEIREKPQAFLTGFRFYKGNNNAVQGYGDAGYDANFRRLEYDDRPFSDYIFPSYNIAFFAENIFHLNQKTSMIPGIRFEHINTTAEGTYSTIIYDLVGAPIFDTLVNIQREDPRSFLIAGIGVTHNIKKDTAQLYFNFSQNYRSITFADMQIENPNFRIDPNLEDERGFNSDFGIKGIIGSALYYDFSIYGLFYNNRIGTTIEKDPILFSAYQYRTNISQSLSAGFEGLIQVDWYRLFKNKNEDLSFTSYINYSATRAYYLDKSSIYYGNFVELVPPVNYKIGLDYKVRNFSAGYQFSWVHWHFSDATNSFHQANAVNGIIPSYLVMDLSLNYKIQQVSLSGGINNLSNEIYFTRRATGYPGPGIITSAPRTYYFTLGIDF